MSYSPEPEPAAFKDVLLDFLNRDSRQINDVFAALAQQQHADLLRQLLNLAVFLCRDRCIMPPGFVAEDALVLRVLEEAESYRVAGLIKWPIRESLDEFWAKKEREYESLRGTYGGLFDQRAQGFVQRNSHLLIDRQSSIGSELVARWEAAPDDDTFWRGRSARTPPAVTNIFGRVPSALLERGVAVTWAAISEQVADLAEAHPGHRDLVQHIYLSLYLEEFDLRVISGLPYARHDFGLGSDEHFYAYDTHQWLLEPVGAWQVLLDLPPEALVRLRRLPAWFDYRRVVMSMCDDGLSAYDFRDSTAIPMSAAATLKKETAAVDRVSSGQMTLAIEPPGDEWVEAFAERLARVADIARDRWLQRKADRASAVQAARRGIASARESLRPSDGGRRSIAIFVALQEERDVLIDRWKLKGVYLQARIWAGELGDADVVVYGETTMGRLPASRATHELFRHGRRPEFIVVVGLAGGFEESDVWQGMLLVPEVIADLSSQKVTPTGPQFRAQAFHIDRRLAAYLGNQIDQVEWAARVVSDTGHWPADNAPSLRIGGPLACLDDVVADDVYRQQLLAAWGKLLGVDMESAGVISIADSQHTPVAVLRAVSDTADPRKTDDEWRRLGMVALAVTLEAVIWNDMMEIDT